MTTTRNGEKSIAVAVKGTRNEMCNQAFSSSSRADQTLLEHLRCRWNSHCPKYARLNSQYYEAPSEGSSRIQESLGGRSQRNREAMIAIERLDFQ